MVKRIVAKQLFHSEHMLGKFPTEADYDIVINEDTDCFLPPLCDVAQRVNCEGDCHDCMKGNDERRIAFKFRKNYFSKKEQKLAYEGLRGAATQSQNRGIAAGPRGEVLATQSQNRGIAAGPRGEVLATQGRGGRDWVNAYELEILNLFLDNGADLSEFTNEKKTIASIRKKYAEGRNDKEEVRGHVWLRSEVMKEYPDYFGWFDKWVDGLSNKPSEMIKAEAERAFNEWISDTNYAQTVFSGVAGWYDRYPRIPYGRATSYTEKNPELFAKSYPFLQSLNRGFKDLLPWRWKNQKEAANKLDPRYLVPETVFTTITVNKSFRTACHRDAGDLNEGLSNLLVLGDGEYTGGYLVFPQVRIAVNVRPGDLLLVNNHEVIHGNTEIKLNHEKAERISIVCYFREKMLELKSFEYENLRKQFVDERRLNKSHELWRPLWNGVSPSMWESQEWYDYMEKHNIEDPYKKENNATIDGFLF